jgi:hypothetical protein
MVSATSKRRLIRIIGVFYIFALVLAAGSYYFNLTLRARIERAMNRNLVGYDTHLRSVHLRFLDGTLFLYGLQVIQEEHPKPAVMEIPTLRVSIQWREVFFGRVVADCLLSQPMASINLIQLRAESARKITLKQEGWQRALESVYPFKINRF